MPTLFNRIRLDGSLPTGERWSTHFDVVFGDMDPPSGAVVFYEDLLTWAQTIAGDTFWTTNGPIRSLLSTVGVVNAVRVELINDGNLAEVAQVDGLTYAGQGTMTKTFQDSVCVSLLTGRPGRSYRGRQYWPALGAAISTTTGRLAGPTPANVAQDVKDLADMIIDAAPSSFQGHLAVYSPKLNVVTPVTQISVGDVIDTQRRRRDTLVEARSVVNI